MSYEKFSTDEVHILHHEDFLIEDEGLRAVFSGNERLFLREIKKRKYYGYEIKIVRKNPAFKLSTVEKISNEFSFTFSTITNAINYLRKQEADI